MSDQKSDQIQKLMTAMTVVQSVTPPQIPHGAEAMTAVIEWGPGGDVIHYSDGNHRDDTPLRFLVTMLCRPGVEMFVLVDDAELEARKDRRVPAIS